MTYAASTTFGHINANFNMMCFRTKILQKTKKRNRAGALVKWLWEQTRVPKVVSSNRSTVYWMDIFHIFFVVRIVMFV